MYVPLTDHKPDVGVSATVFMGDRMLEQREGEYRDCLVPKFSVEKGMNLGVAKFVLKEGEPACKQDASSKYYTPNYVNWLGGSDVRLTLDLAVQEEKNGTLKICMVQMGMKSGCIKDVKPDQVSYGPWFLYSKNALQQTIEYAGKSGTVLKFVYSEFADSMARDAFTREFQIDLSEGTTLAYKGAVIEVENATNSQITYKVIRNFQS
jgi:hypothetical protein